MPVPQLGRAGIGPFFQAGTGREGEVWGCASRSVGWHGATETSRLGRVERFFPPGCNIGDGRGQGRGLGVSTEYIIRSGRSGIALHSALQNKCQTDNLRVDRGLRVAKSASEDRVKGISLGIDQGTLLSGNSRSAGHGFDKLLRAWLLFPAPTS